MKQIHLKQRKPFISTLPLPQILVTPQRAFKFSVQSFYFFSSFFCWAVVSFLVCLEGSSFFEVVDLEADLEASCFCWAVVNFLEAAWGAAAFGAAFGAALVVAFLAEETLVTCSVFLEALAFSANLTWAVVNFLAGVTTGGGGVTAVFVAAEAEVLMKFVGGEEGTWTVKRVKERATGARMVFKASCF